MNAIGINIFGNFEIIKVQNVEVLIIKNINTYC